jgi:hypothetical protein
VTVRAGPDRDTPAWPCPHFGSLPTLAEFVAGTVPSGIRYFDGFGLFPTTYYALKHRKGNTIVTLYGPTIRVHMVHSRSARFASVGGDIQNCALCHLTPPAGPLRGSGIDGLP